MTSLIYQTVNSNFKNAKIVVYIHGLLANKFSWIPIALDYRVIINLFRSEINPSQF